ncbi:phage holin [Staphylococcus saprophyticus]|uniref:phage holin n=1 Tax=Staphylococcus saprophyticus TaxID=29385 RepID=UPI000853EB62|nr:phage holin [Staphylococcus saprophyticus]
MKKINWQVRLKKKSFWVAIVSAVALFINNITGAFGLDYSASIEQGVSIITSLLTLLAGLGIIIDPTTKGVKDSEKATEYTKPRDDKDPNQFLQWEVEGNAFTPTEYDTREPFSDDSDEIDFHETLLDGGESPDSVTVEVDEETPDDDTNEGLGQREEPSEVKEVK